MWLLFFVVMAGVPSKALEPDNICPNVVARSEWNASAPLKLLRPYRIRPKNVVIHLVLSNCTDAATCSADVKILQIKEQKKKYDIGYNFCVAPDLRIYEGRGWDVIGFHAQKFNSRSIGICIMGNYVKYPMPASMEKVTIDFLACAARKGLIRHNYDLLTHVQVSTVPCPGDMIQETVRYWPHFAPVIRFL